LQLADVWLSGQFSGRVSRSVDRLDRPVHPAVLGPDHRPALGRCRGGWAPGQGTLRRRARRALPGGPAQGGLKRSLASDGHGIPLGLASAGANRHDSPLLAPTLHAASQQLDHLLPAGRTCHLDRGYDSQPTRRLLDDLGFDGQIARKGIPAPLQAGTRWVVERTHSWMNRYGKLRRCTERNAKIVDFYLPRRRARHDPPADPASPRPLPLGHPPDHQAAQVTHLLPGALSYAALRAR